ncbi:UNVERIFIED_CONTAM: Endo-1,4-beta-xylanase 1 [Sesamum angustifolium]|uniref:Endo-1,4-beta-xylanase 1 n=1 Tax=Sesamum angustifolium TaxID=2727405 RepID=A0AAW2NL27_9LAMI
MADGFGRAKHIRLLLLIEFLYGLVICIRTPKGTGPLCKDNENIIQNPRFDDGVNRLCGRCCKIALHDSDGKVLPMSGKVVASTENCTEIGHEIQQEIMGRVQKKPTCESVGAVRVFGYNISSSDQKALH